MEIAPENIGFGIVRRTFTIGERRVRNGDRLDGEELRALPTANRRALIANGYIEVSHIGDESELARENEQLRAQLNAAQQEIKSLKATRAKRQA